MRKIIEFSAYLLLGVFIGHSAAYSGGSSFEKSDITPAPQEIEFLNGEFAIGSALKIYLPRQTSAGTQFAAEELRNELKRRLDLELEIISKPSEVTSSTIYIGNPDNSKHVRNLQKKYKLKLRPEMEDEGYVLGIGEEGVVIAGSSDAGLLYGAMSLIQLLVHHAQSGSIPHLAIHDYPSMSMRGIHDEISYGQVSTEENFKEMIHFLAYFKMNTLMLYIEDVFKFNSYPFIGVDRGALSPELIDRLEAYAKPYNVEIIPLFETLANQGALLMLPEMLDLAEFPGAHSFAISDETYEFLDTAIGELAAAFDSDFIHAGLDESWDLGYGKTEELINRQGRAKVHADHYIKVNKIIQKYDKRMMMYADIILKHPEILNMLTTDIVLMDWHYRPAMHFPSVKQLAAHNFPVVILPGMNNWKKFFPEQSRATTNIKYYTQDAKSVNSMGSLVSTWGDFGSKNLRELLYAGYGYGAELSWSTSKSDLTEYYKNFFSFWNGPETADHFVTIYNLLEQWPWEDSIMEYFQHPFLPQIHSAFSVQDLIRIELNARSALSAIEELRNTISYRAGDLDYLEYIAKTYLNYSRGQILVRELQNANSIQYTNRYYDYFIRRGVDVDEYSGSSLYLYPSREAAQEKFISEIDDVIGEVRSLRDQFKELWLRTNLNANLQYALDEYNDIIKSWDQIRHWVQDDKFFFDPRTPAQWIYHPENENDAGKGQFATFQKEIIVENIDNVEHALIQLYGDTHIKVYVNEVLVAEQFVRRNLSAPVNPRLLQLHDIGQYLETGSNYLMVEASNYGGQNQGLEPAGPDRAGGFYLYGEIQYQTSTDTLMSDDSWRTRLGNSTRNVSAPAADNPWVKAKPGQVDDIYITYPDVEKRWKGTWANPQN